MTDLEKEVQEAFEEMAHKMGMCLDQYWGDGYDNPYENDDTRLAYNIFREGAKSKQAEITELKQKLEKLESGEFVLVPKKDLSTWYLDEAEGLWTDEADSFLHEIEAGQVFTVQRQHNFSLPVSYIARPYIEDDQDAGYWEEYATREEAEKVAQHCKAMIEAVEKDHE